MNVKDFFLGTPDERESGRVLSDLSKAGRQHPLSYEQINQRDASRTNWMRLRIRQLLSAAVPTALIASGIYFSKDEEAVPPPSTVAPAPLPPVARLESPFLEEAAVRDIYDKGFELLMAGVPENPTDVKGKVLRNFQLFRQNEVDWIELTPEGRYQTLEAGKLTPAFMAVLPREFPGVEKRPVLAVSYRPGGPLVLNVKPVPMTPEWAGIFQLHELGHLIDRVKGIEPPNPSAEQYLSGEARAFSVEALGADHMTKGTFSKAVAHVIEQYDLKTYKDLLALLRSERESEFIMALRHFPGSSVTATLPKSADEDALRVAFCTTAVGQQLIQSQDKPQTEKDAEHRDLIQQLMDQYGAGRNIPRQ